MSKLADNAAASAGPILEPLGQPPVTGNTVLYDEIVRMAIPDNAVASPVAAMEQVVVAIVAGQLATAVERLAMAGNILPVADSVFVLPDSAAEAAVVSVEPLGAMRETVATLAESVPGSPGCPGVVIQGAIVSLAQVAVAPLADELPAMSTGLTP